MKKDFNLFNVVTVAIIALWLILFAFLPNIMVFTVSFMERSEQSFVAAIFTLSNYTAFFNSMYFSIFVDSFQMAALTTSICLVVGYPFAYILARTKSKYKNMLALFVIIPYWTSALIRTYAIKVILTTNGLINIALMKIGIIDAPLNMLYTQGAVILGLVYTLLPFMILPLYATIDKFDVRYVEASQDLGAGRIQTFIHIIIPLTTPGIIAGCLLVFLPSLGLFYIPDILGGAKNLLIGNLIRDQFLNSRNWPLGSAASVLLTVTMALMMLAYYWSVKTINRKVL